MGGRNPFRTTLKTYKTPILSWYFAVWKHHPQSLRGAFLEISSFSPPPFGRPARPPLGRALGPWAAEKSLARRCAGSSSPWPAPRGSPRPSARRWGACCGATSPSDPRALGSDPIHEEKPTDAEFDGATGRGERRGGEAFPTRKKWVVFVRWLRMKVVSVFFVFVVHGWLSFPLAEMHVVFSVCLFFSWAAFPFLLFCPKYYFFGQLKQMEGGFKEGN